MNLNLPAIPVFSSQIDAQDITDALTPKKSTTRAGKDALLILGGLLVIILLIAALIAIFRRKKIRRLSKLSRSAWPASASKNQNPGGAPLRRHRHHRRDHRPRNPTLAETGGLPPRRSEDQLPSGS